MKFKVAIPSYNRFDRIAGHPLLPVAHVVVPESQMDRYTETIGGKCAALVPHPNLVGVAPTRNFILTDVYDAETEDFVFMCDDDLQDVRFLMSRRTITIKKPEDLLAIIAHTARLALDAGVHVFGYARTPRPHERRANDPFAFRRVVEANAMGVIGNSMRFDTDCIVAEDFDFCLQAVEKDRILLQDTRYAWVFDRWTVGGLAVIRTTESVKRSHDYLSKKWGRGIIVPHTRRATGQGVRVNIR